MSSSILISHSSRDNIHVDDHRRASNAGGSPPTVDDGSEGSYESGDGSVDDFDAEYHLQAMLDFDDQTSKVGKRTKAMIEDVMQNMEEIDSSRFCRNPQPPSVARNISAEQKAQLKGMAANQGKTRDSTYQPPVRKANEVQYSNFLLFITRQAGNIVAEVRVDKSTLTAIDSNDDFERAAMIFNNDLVKRKPPPYILVSENSLPSIDDCATLFNLRLDQYFAFTLIAQTLLDEKAGLDPPQLKLAISGMAGTGKSMVMRAVLWFSFQHRISHYIGISSAFWKAAILMQTSFNPAFSNCRFYGMNPRKRSIVPGTSNSSRNCCHADIKLLFLEEGSTTGLLSFDDMNIGARNLGSERHSGRDCSFMGGFHFVTTFDIVQHNPVRALALYEYSSHSPDQLKALLLNPKIMKEVRARIEWMKINKCIILTEQQRFDLNTPGGKILWEIIQICWLRRKITEQEMDQVLDALQARCIEHKDMNDFLQR